MSDKICSLGVDCVCTGGPQFHWCTQRKLRIVPTHFIEVYNREDEYKNLQQDWCVGVNKNVLPINLLKSCIEYTNNLFGLQTIAIWKIRMK